ncbi:hypothetical protein Tco_0145622 [Tanacetum coccineum]
MVEADQLLTERMLAREQEELSDEQKASMFMQLLEKRRKLFAAKRAEAKRNKSPTQAQQRKLYFIKNMFDKAFKRVNTFVDMNIELEKAKEKNEDSSEKKVAGRRKKSIPRKRAAGRNNDGKELKKCFELVIDDEELICPVPLATKPAPIVDFLINTKRKLGYYEIFKADGSKKVYHVFSQLLCDFDREDLVNLWSLVKAKHRDNKLEDGFERVFWGIFKVMFEPDQTVNAAKRLQLFQEFLLSEVKDCLENKDTYEEVKKSYHVSLENIVNQTRAPWCINGSSREELADFINTPNWNRPAFYFDGDDDEEYTIAITPDLPTEEPDKSLSMGDAHLSTIPETKLDELIKSSVEDLVPIPSESEGISDSMCDVPFCENSHPLDALKDHSEIFSDPNDDYASSDDDPLYNEDIDYVDASPPDSELVSLEEDDILHEKLLNINILIAKIKALNDNPTPSTDSVLKSPFLFPNSFLEETDTSDNSLPESEIFYFDMEEKRSGNPTYHSDLSLHHVSFPSGTRNKIFDPGIFLQVQSKRFLSPNEFSISFIHDPLSLVFDTLLPFLSKNEDKVFNSGILASNEDKSPHLLSHPGFKVFQLISDFSESSMMISGGDIPILDVPFLHFDPP